MHNHRLGRFVLCGLVSLLALSLFGCGGGPTEPPPPRQLIGVSIQPATAQTIAPDGTVPFTATGTYDQAPSTQPNLPVTWASSDTNIATVDSSGTATCLTVGGPVTITGSTNGKGGTVKGSGSLTCQLSPNPVAKLDPAGLGWACQNRVMGACGCFWAHGSSATLTNVGGEPLAITSVDKTAFPFTETNTCVGSTLDTGQSCQITLRADKQTAKGTFHYQVTISDNALDSPQTLSITTLIGCIP